MTPRSLLKPMQFSRGKTIIALNVGGALIPISFSLYLITLHTLNTIHLTLAILTVAFISYLFSRPIKGLGIGIPIFIAPITAALSAIILSPENSAPLYVA